MPDYEFYEGASTGQQIDESVQKGIISVNCGTISALPFTKTNANILASHVVLAARLSTPLAQSGEWVVTTADGSLTITGELTTSTGLILFLGRAAQSIT